MNEDRVYQILEEITAALAELSNAVNKHISEHKDDEDIEKVAEAISRFNLPVKLDD